MIVGIKSISLTIRNDTSFAYLIPLLLQIVAFKHTILLWKNCVVFVQNKEALILTFDNLVDFVDFK